MIKEKAHKEEGYVDIEALKQEVIAYSKTIGIDKIGFASADVFTELKERLIQQEESGFASGFEKGTMEERTEPKKLLPVAKSIISIALAYPSRIQNPPKSKKGERRGIFCRASWGEDYHVVLRKKLNQLYAFIEEMYPEFYGRVMVDTGELNDGAVAERAGVGFAGKNTMLIKEEYGSWVYLGERRGIFCRASWGEDYHVVLRKKLNQLYAFIEEMYPEFYGRVMVDTGELNDGAVAERAGVGFAGKNTMLITEEFGSWVYLGEMITNIPFIPDKPVEDSCGDCRICLDACPTGALVEAGRLNAHKCLAFLTQTKDFLPEEYR